MILKEICAKNNIKKKDIAEYLSLSVRTISNYEQGLREPDIDTLIKIADYFNVSLDYLLGRENITNKNIAILYNEHGARYQYELKSQDTVDSIISVIKTINKNK